MATDKWLGDFLPVIERSRYKELLPRHGGGSRGGGTIDAIRFRHGPTLKFMSGGGKDKRRAAFTSRVLAVTETDALDEAGTTSREADKLTQLEGRTRAYGSRKQIYLECTASTDIGRTWREYKAGTESRIALRCVHCRAFVIPEREHLVGWQDAETEVDAKEQSHFVCPACNHAWTEADRYAAHIEAVVIHRGQEIAPDGSIKGDPPRTDTLGFRWSAVNNMFVTAGDIGADEWRGSRAADEENAEKELRQFVWALPYVSPIVEAASLTNHQLIQRTSRQPRGIIPDGTIAVTVGVDLGKYLAHWIVVAWGEQAAGHIVDYGRFEIASDQLGIEAALLAALREFRDLCAAGWGRQGGGQPRQPDQLWIDSGYQTDTVYAFIRESRSQQIRPTKGYGASQDRKLMYRRPQRTGSTIRGIGQNYHMVLLRKERIHLVELDADHWKSFAHQRLSTPMNEPGAMTLFQAMPRDHFSIAKHFTSERQVEEYVAGRGIVTRWERMRRQNHWFDALYLSCAAGHFCGIRLLQQEEAVTRPEPRKRRAFTTPDGRPFFVTER